MNIMMNKHLNIELDEKIWEKHLENVHMLLSIGRKASMDNLERAKVKQA